MKAMKKVFSRLMLFGACVTLNSVQVNAQQICMVTADYQDAENYIVMWEEIGNPTIDSIFIYRKAGTESLFTKIGSVKYTDVAPTYFVDSDVNTMDTTKYAISYLYLSGIESARSPWHQAVVMDYDETFGMGYFFWTKYKKENQIDENYIFGYECNIDESGLGLYSNIGFWDNQTTSWEDANWIEHTNSLYEILVQLPDCNILTKANINTSRSNIKNQQSNAAVMEEEQSASVTSLKGINYTISPNPVADIITISSAKSIDGKCWITNVRGEQVMGSPISGSTFSMNTSELQAGVYFISIEVAGGN
jgi:hypothetical protein